MPRIFFNIARIWNSQFKCNYLKNEKLFLKFPFHFWNLHQILDILKKNMMVIANVFPKLQTVKKFVTQLCKKGIFGILLESRHVKVPRILAKSPWEYFYHVFSSIWRKLILKISPLGLDQTYGVFFNTLTADGKYPIEYCGNFFQVLVSENRKTFSEFFVRFHECTSNFKHFEKKDDGLS